VSAEIHYLTAIPVSYFLTHYFVLQRKTVAGNNARGSLCPSRHGANSKSY
jgi:hypothetical protein